MSKVVSTYDSGTINIPDTDNVANTIVLRDASGNFSAGTITASLSGNATTATTATTANNIPTSDVGGNIWIG